MAIGTSQPDPLSLQDAYRHYDAPTGHRSGDGSPGDVRATGSETLTD